MEVCEGSRRKSLGMICLERWKGTPLVPNVDAFVAVGVQEARGLVMVKQGCIGDSTEKIESWLVVMER